MCTLNGERWLGEQLASILAQTHEEWTLWISDDGSRDGTLRVIEAFDRDHPGRIERLVAGPRRGSAANYLALLGHPELVGSHVALSDQDDVWKPEKLARAMAAFEGRDGPQAYAAAYYVSDRHLHQNVRSSPWPLGPLLGNAAVQNIMSGHTTVLDPKALEIVRRAGPVPVRHHDWWIYLLLTGTGAEIRIDPEPMVYYRQHREAAFGARRGLRAASRRFRNLAGNAYSDWVNANLEALGSIGDALTPEARQLVEGWRSIPDRAGPRRIAAFRRLGLVRQNYHETLLLYMAAGMGWL
jgi:glycosyltransferase involved in cell wall biosynthesis